MSSFMKYVSLYKPLRHSLMHNDRMQQHGIIWSGEELNKHPDNYVNLLTLESFTLWSPFNLQVLDLLLKGPQLVSKAVTHAKTVSKQSILTQTDELQRRVDKWGHRQLTSPVHRMLQRCL